MHRDVKFDNVLIDLDKRKLVLADFGLGGFYFHNTSIPGNANSKFYKPPEVLLHMRKYDYSVDMWALGTMFASMIFLNSEDHFFRRSRKSEIPD